jgi:hypothetical protein
MGGAIRPRGLSATGVTEAKAEVFKLEPFSILDYDGPLKYSLRMGQPVLAVDQTPSTKVRAYPSLKSEKPLYGRAAFGTHPFDTSPGDLYHFVIDESGGTGSGYDRLVFDQNGDLDLSNDPVISKAADPPKGLGMEGFPGTQVVFDTFDVVLNANKGQVRKQRVIPQYQGLQDQHIVSFLAPMGRKGRIKIGSQAFDCILAQSVISGGFDNVWISCHLDGKSQGLDVLGYWPYVDGAFHMRSVDRAGTKLTVRSYTGPLGSFNIAAPAGITGDIGVGMGWIMGEDRIIDLMKCPQQGGKAQVPAGDYRPIQLAVDHDQKRITLSVAPPDPTVERAIVPASIRVRETGAIAFGFPEFKDVQFKWAKRGAKFKPGDEVKVEASIGNLESGLVLGGLEDLTKLEQTLKLPDGTDYQRYASIDPRIVITNSKEERVAQGKMPFG